jgi:chorismate-pyruvate lyase
MMALVSDPEPDDGGLLGPAEAGRRLADALARYGGTVTELVEDLVGEPIDADRLVQHDAAAGVDDPLGVGPGHPVVRRAAVLRGRRTGVGYVYAESTIAADRLPASVRHQLETTDRPIGRILVDHGLVLARAPLSPGGGPQLVVDGAVARAVGGAIHARRYRIDVGGRPAMAICEWFLADLAPSVSAPR